MQGSAARSLPEKQLTALLGPSGSGKTTLLRSLELRIPFSTDPVQAELDKSRFQALDLQRGDKAYIRPVNPRVYPEDGLGT